MSEAPALIQWMLEKLDVSAQTYTVLGSAETRAFLVDLSRFRLRLSERTPCIELSAAQTRQLTPAQQRRFLQDVVRANDWQRTNVLVLTHGNARDLKVLCRNDNWPPLILDTEAQDRIMAGSPNSNLLIEEISRQSPISALSPYETSAPVTGEQFFGRDSEIRHILQNQNASFLVVGNRRMGKTSLIREVQRRMIREAGSDRAQRYFDCSIFKNRFEFYAELVRQLDGPREVDRIYSDATFSIHSFIQRMARARREKIVLFLDEIDFLLDWDQRDGWSVLSMLRGLTSTPQGHSPRSPHEHSGEPMYSHDDKLPLRVIMAGFRVAQAYAESRETPLFNFVSTVQVGNFDWRQTEQIVLEPMLNLGLTITDRNALVNRIYRETGGQPNLIQHYCQFIIRRLEDIGEREVNTSLLDAAMKDSIIRRRTTSQLLANTTNLEQLVIFCYLHDKYTHAHGEKFVLAEVDAWLQDRNITLRRNALEATLYALETSGVFQRDGKYYGFAFAMLPRILIENYDANYQIKKILEEGIDQGDDVGKRMAI